MLRQTLRSILFACFLFILMPGQSLPVVAAQANPIPGPTGPYKVGVDWRHWVDNSRDETFDNAPHGRREMMVEFLYPANPVPDAKPAAYMANRKAILPAFAEVAASVGAPTIWDPAEFAQFQAHSYPKAALSDGQPQYPVLIFSHGAGGEATMYTAQLEELASYGYVVVAIDHAYGAAATVFPDGRVLKSNFSTGLEGAAPIWAQDQIFVMDQLEKINVSDPDGLFTKHLNIDQMGIFGHSNGGAAATITCFIDKRCKAGVNEDGPVFGDVIKQGLDQPFMYMLSDGRLYYDPASYAQTHGPFYQAEFKGFEHLDFGDFPLWPNMKPIRDAHLLGSVNSARSVKITRAYLLAFFDKYVKGKDSPLLAGPSSAYPEVTLTTRNMPS